MATRREIREAFQTHLKQSTTLTDNVGQEQPESEEELPALVYRGSYRKIALNGASGAPSDVNTDSNGNVTQEIYETVHEASFGVGVFDVDEQRREDIYEDVRSYFEKYELPAWDVSTIQGDINTIRVLDSDPEDDPDRTPSQRGDRLIIRLQYTRQHIKDVDHVSTVDQSIQDVNRTVE